MPQLGYVVEQRMFLVQLYFKSESAGKCQKISVPVSRTTTSR